MNLRSCKYTAAQGTAPAAPLRYNSSLYYLFCAKRSSFFQQNVHRRSKTAPNAFFFGQFAACPGAVLTNPAALCYNFHDFRQEAGPAGRSPPYTIFSRRIFETDAMKGSAVGLQADWQAPFFCFSAAQSQEETDENQKLFSGPQCRAGRTLSGTGLRAAHGDGPSAAGRQYALPDAFPHPALRLRAGRTLGSGCGLCGPAAPLGALRDAPDVPHRHFDGF